MSTSILPFLSNLSIGSPAADKNFSSLEQALRYANVNVATYSHIDRAYVDMVKNGQLKYVVEVTDRGYQVSRDSMDWPSHMFNEGPMQINRFVYAESVILQQIQKSSVSGYIFKVSFWDRHMQKVG